MPVDQSVAWTQKLDQIVDKYKRESSFHGNLFLKVGSFQYQSSHGLASVAFQIQNQLDYRFMIASVSKQFTAALILKLAEEKIVDLDRPYGQYVETLPDMQEEDIGMWNKVTLREILSHSAGLNRDLRTVEYYSTEAYNPLMSLPLLANVETYSIFNREYDGKSRYSNLG